MEPESPGQLQAAQVSRLEGAEQKDSSGALAEGRVPETLGARGWGHLLLTPPGLLGRCSTIWFTLGNTSGTGFTGPQVSCTVFLFSMLKTRPRSPHTQGQEQSGKPC